ncbi:hypothetical protein [Hydrogenovibrio sp. JE_KL2]|uniref:hypothetical protein n=1 Tax=Hydrogenovibrio sp. JE_KL2 TaxID=2651188 RepID=UPI00128BF570|nr:hypothetical protein [Hydrogenovibrio sp. JE_KL2]MPQ77305.1 hypothetical protein [Hydrogenovibrio sp. JE_KL2]
MNLKKPYFCAKEWKYEKEWRLIGNQGVQSSPLFLKEIIFGLRCDLSVIHTIINGLKGRNSPVKFFRMHYSGNEYNLKKEEIDLDELSRTLPREAQIIDMLDDIEIN